MGDKKATDILNLLINKFPDASCELNYSSGFELLVAVILSAQCTDKRVNIVTKELFAKANTPSQMLELGSENLQKIIYPCGFYRQKTKSILMAATVLLEKYNGTVPNDIDALTAITGVGRKTANVVLSELFNSGGMAVDTHVFRTAKRLGLASGNTPKKVELELNKLFKGNTKAAHQTLVWFGRYLCKSQRPLCADCPVVEYCVYSSKSFK